MNRVATANNYSSVLNNLMQAQVRQQAANAQVSSQKNASDLKGYAKQAETLLATRSLQTKVDGYLAQGDQLTSRLEAQNLALTQVADSTQSARQAIAEALATGRGEALMGEIASWFSSAADSINAKYAGRYLFSGGQVDSAATTATKITDLTAGPPIASMFQNDGLTPVSQLDESTTIQTGFLASDIGTSVFSAFQQMQAYVEANGDFTGNLTPAQETFLQGMLDDFDVARSTATDYAARNGLVQNRVDKVLAAQEDRKAMLEGMVGSITDADMPLAITRLEQAQVAVQASAQVFNMLSQSSLLGLLK
ncbi:MAG TPA: flagellin [Caulobacter sp.]|nr:flagellin [Caulobacter sp.]